MRLIILIFSLILFLPGCSGNSTSTSASAGLPLERSRFLTEMKYPGASDITDAEFAAQNASLENSETAKKAGHELPDMVLRGWNFRSSDSIDKVKDFFKSKVASEDALIDDSGMGEAVSLEEALAEPQLHVAIEYIPKNAKKAPQSVIENYGNAMENVSIFLTKLSDGGTLIDISETVLLK